MNRIQRTLDQFYALLDKHGARKVNHITDDERHSVEVYSVKGKFVLIQLFPTNAGFEVYIPVSESNRIDETITALEKYLEAK